MKTSGCSVLNYSGILIFISNFNQIKINTRMPMLSLILMVLGQGPGPNGLALTPPMGWMSWEIFRCETVTNWNLS